MAAIFLSDLLQAVGISEQQLADPVSDDHLRRMSLFLTSWRRLAPFLDMGEADTEVIGEEGRGEEDKRLKMLQRWKTKNAFKATYRKLVDALLSLGKASHAEKVCRLLQPEAGGRQPDAVEIVHQLREACSRVPPSPENRLKLLQQMQSLSAELQQSSREEIEALRREIETQRTEMDTLRRTNETLQTELSTKTTEMGTLRREIETLQTERRELDSMNSSLRDEFERMKSEVEDGPRRAKVPRLSVYQSAENSESPTGLSRLQWRRGNNAPGVPHGTPAVIMGERVYVRGEGEGEVYQYDWKRSTWSILPDCPVRLFGMAQFLGKLLTVGGKENTKDSDTGKVYQFNGQQWEEFLPAMPTARSCPTVVTRITSSASKPPAIVACGGYCDDSLYKSLNTVEVYSHASSQWHTAKSLPLPWCHITSAIIDDTCYLLGGRVRYSFSTSCYFASLDSLVDSATSSSSQLDDPVWNQVSDTPLTLSTAATLRGSLIAVGGSTHHSSGPTDIVASKSIHIFTNDGSWERVRGDLPEPRRVPAVLWLPSGELMVIGGFSAVNVTTKTVFIASMLD